MEKTGCMVQCEKYTDADAFLKTEYSLVDKLPAKKRDTGSFRCPASVFKGAYARVFFEDTTKIALLRIADSLTDLAY